jgi:hypothetical protein
MTEVSCAAMRRQRLLCRCSVHDRVRVISACSFGFHLHSRSNWPYSARYWDYGWWFLGARGGVMDVQSAVLSPRSCPYLLQFRFPSRVRVRVRIQVQHHCSFGPFYAVKRRAVPLSGQSYGRRNPPLPRRWRHRHRRRHHRRIWGAEMQKYGVS